MKNIILKAYSKFYHISYYDPNNSFPEYNSKNYCSKTIKGYKLHKGKKKLDFLMLNISQKTKNGGLLIL